MSSSHPWQAEVTFVDKQYQRPPLVTLLFNIRLRNDYSKPLWFLLPSKLNLPTSPVKNGVDGVDVFISQGQGQALLGNFQGTGGFQALRVPSKGDVTLQNVAIAFWGEPPKDRLPMEIIVAEELTIGGKPAEAWFGRDPSSDVVARVDITQAKRLSSKHIDDRSEVNVSITGEHRITLEVALRK